MWTEPTREQYRRDYLIYASDLTEAEWLLLSLLLPAPRRIGRPRKVDLRAVMNAILYILATGCQWRALPKNFPPRSMVQYYFYLWRDQRIWRRINLALVTRAGCIARRRPAPSAGVIDSQSVKTTESGGPRGFDAAKRLKGRKRHLATDTIGVTLDFSRPGKPTDNAFIEAFNGRFRAECLNTHWFMSLADAQEKMEDWRKYYNKERPHGAIGQKPPIMLLNYDGAASPPS